MCVCACARVRARMYENKFINGGTLESGVHRVEFRQVAAMCVLGTEISGIEASVPATSLFVWGVEGVSRTDLVACGEWG